jgi:hypothetical protein
MNDCVLMRYVRESQPRNLIPKPDTDPNTEA